MALFCASFVVPLGWLFFGYHGAIISAVGVILGLLVTSTFAETILGKLHRTSDQRSTSNLLEQTLTTDLSLLILQSAEGKKEGSTPKIVLLLNPSVTVFLAKSLFSHSGTLFLSQGVLNLLSQEELRAVLMTCYHRTHDPVLKLQSLSAVLAATAIHGQLLPKSWVRTMLFETPVGLGQKTNPFSFLLFFVFFPLFKAVLYFSGAPSKQRRPQTGKAANPAFDRAMQKLVLESQRSACENNPGAVRLYLLNPWPNSLLNLELPL